MKFAGTCMVCNQKIAVNETGLWAKGIGVKHEKCAGTAGIACSICGKPAGCADCEFADDCNTEAVSQLCICRGCQGADSLERYRLAVGRKFPALKT